MGNITVGNHPKIYHDEILEKDNIIKYDITLHKLIDNNKAILNSIKNMEKYIDNDMVLISTITNDDKSIMNLSSYA